MMKRLITYLACLAGLVLASSCSVHDTVLKRHYMKGYYVGKHQHAGTPATAQRAEKASENAAMPARLEVALQPEKIGSPTLPQRSDKDISPVALPKQERVSSQAQSVNVHSLTKPSLNLRKTMDLKKPLASDRDGLSLFWIVILVLLILWAVGYFAGGLGMGGLINLLLLVALILLILWLLKII